MYEINRFFPINSLFFVQICPGYSEILSTDLKNPRALDGYVQHNEILNLLIIFLEQLRLAKFSFFIFEEKIYARKFRAERTFSEKVVQQAFRQFFNIF